MPSSTSARGRSFPTSSSSSSRVRSSDRKPTRAGVGDREKLSARGLGRGPRAQTPAAAAYRPPWWYRGRHLQTLWGPLLRRGRAPTLLLERVETPDGDFVDLDWLAGRERGAPLVVVLHGLEGSSRSHYAVGLLRGLEEVGWRGLVIHFRSCSGEVNRSRRLYHSGDTEDLEFMVGLLLARDPQAPLGLVGISLGGNVLLKWLGELGERIPASVAAAVAISTPFNLAACAAVLDRGLNRRLYTANFLSTMKAKVDEKAHLYRGLLDLPAARRARTFAEYDRLVTAPLDGFAGRHSWGEARALAFLDRHLSTAIC